MKKAVVRVHQLPAPASTASVRLPSRCLVQRCALPVGVASQCEKKTRTTRTPQKAHSYNHTKSFGVTWPNYKIPWVFFPFDPFDPNGSRSNLNVFATEAGINRNADTVVCRGAPHRHHHFAHGLGVKANLFRKSRTPPTFRSCTRLVRGQVGGGGLDRW